MYERLGHWVTRNPWRVVGGWLVLVVVAVALLPALATRVNPDTSGTLPASAEAARAAKLAAAAFPGRPESTGVIVFSRTDGGTLTAADSDRVAQAVAALRADAIAGVVSVTTSPASLSPEHRLQLGNVAFAENANADHTATAVKALRASTPRALAGSGLSAAYSGEAPIAVDNADAVASAAGVVAAATIGLIAILQLLIFRSVLAALIPVLSVGVVQVVAGGVAGGLSSLFGYKVASFAPILVIVVLFGVGTDYILFLLFRYRERLRAGDLPREALVAAVARVGEAVTSAAGVVALAFATLVVSPLGSFRTLGPTLAACVLVMMAAALTLVPAVFTLLGERIFWPSKKWRETPEGRFAAGLGQLTARRPGPVAVACALLFGVLAVGAVGGKLDYDPVGQLPQAKESAKAYTQLRGDFPAGVLTPVAVYLAEDSSRPLDASAEQPFGAALAGVDGVAAVGPAVVSPNGSAAQFSVILKSDPYDGAALDLVSGPLTAAAHAAAPPGTQARVGGPTSSYAGIREANTSGLRLALPIAALLIGLVLALMLRGLAGPVLLIGSVFLGFAGVLGASFLVFQHLQGKAGLQFVIPLTMYLFVVAIGTDYNILMVSRLRDEARAGSAPRDAVRVAVARTAPAVAAGGLVLAGSFAALILAGIGFLTQMGFAVSLGIALCAFVMAILLVPSLAALAGRRFWWPGRPGPAAAAPVVPLPGTAEPIGERP